MPIQTVPISNDARQNFDTTLDGQLVRFDVWWQAYDGAWYFSLAWQSGTKIISGARLVVGVNLLSGVVSEFTGSLTVRGLSNLIGFEAWGVTHLLYYDSEG